MSAVAWTLQPVKDGPHIRTRIGVWDDPFTRVSLGEARLTPEQYADLARRLDVAHCTGCGRQIPTSEVRAGFTTCEHCPRPVPADTTPPAFVITAPAAVDAYVSPLDIRHPAEPFDPQPRDAVAHTELPPLEFPAPTDPALRGGGAL